MSFVGLFTVVPLILLSGAFIFGSVLARRGEKSWRTMLMLVGSVAQGAGIVTYMAVMGFFLMNLRTSSLAGMDSMFTWTLVMGGSAIIILGGMILFAIGFVTYCARAGAAAQRAVELEEMLKHIQGRLAEEGGA